MDSSRPHAIILAHPNDQAFAIALSQLLRTDAPRLSLQVNSALGSAPVVQKEHGPFILVVSQNLLADPSYSQVAATFHNAAREGRLLSVSLHPFPQKLDFPKRVYVQMSEVAPGSNPAAIERVGKWLKVTSQIPPDAQPSSSLMMQPVRNLALPTRTKTLLSRMGIELIGELVQRREADLLRTYGFGRESLYDVYDALAEHDLRLGMDPSSWDTTRASAGPDRPTIATEAAQLEQLSGGANFEVEGDQFAIVEAHSEDDRSTALKPLVTQLQEALVEKAQRFAGLARRLDNQPGWAGIAEAAHRIATLLGRPAHDIADVLGHLYAQTLELGSFLELDQRLLSENSGSSGSPLDPEMRRPLEDLIRNLAPWLRSFPSIRELDEQASNFLIHHADLQPTVEVLESAFGYRLISNDTADVIRGLVDAAKRGEFQGGKAGGIAKRSMINLVVVTTVTMAVGMFTGAVSGNWGATSPLVKHCAGFLTRAENEISKLIAEMPDLRYTIEAFAKEIADHPPLIPTAPKHEPASGTQRRRDED